MDLLRFKDLEIAYSYRKLEGDPNAPTVFLLHGLGASGGSFDHAANGISSVASVCIVDFPGHGDSLLLDEQPRMTFQLYSDVVLALASELGVKRAMFVGISMGAAISMLCAQRFLHQCLGVVAIRPSWLEKSKPPHLRIVARIGRWLSECSNDVALQKLEADAEYTEMKQEVPLAASSLRKLCERQHAHKHARVLFEMFEDTPFQSLSELKKLETPVRVLSTNADSLHPVSVARTLSNALHFSSLRNLPARYIEPDAYEQALAASLVEFIHEVRNNNLELGK